MDISKRFTFRLSMKLFNDIVEQAHICGVSPGEYVRRCLEWFMYCSK